MFAIKKRPVKKNAAMTGRYFWVLQFQQINYGLTG
jgi:hypothetical protein